MTPALTTFVLLLASGTPGQGSDDAQLGLADLAAYRAALEPPASSRSAPVAVRFEDLWSHPDRFRGRLVRIEGRVVRRFRQEAVGTFPALSEVWVVSPSGNPTCLVFPDSKAPAEVRATQPGSTIRFVGTFLRRLRYEGGDGARLAPLVVGGRPPEFLAPASGPEPKPGRSDSGRRRTDWALGLAAGAAVVLTLGWLHLRRPPRRADLGREPAPDFVDDAPLGGSRDEH